MREIKFRGKTKDGEWVYGYVDATAYKDLVVIHSEATTYEVLPETVGQNTGLEDANGNDIYEGDIVKVHESPFEFTNIGIVVYDPTRARFHIQGEKRGRMFKSGFIKADTYRDGYCTVECKYDYIVVGNVYDNPELL